MIIRNDLSVGQKLAQCIHASGESAFGIVFEGTRAVALCAQNQEELLELEQILIDNRVRHKAIREPDLNNELVAIGLKPVERMFVYKFVKKFKLIK